MGKIPKNKTKGTEKETKPDQKKKPPEKEAVGKPLSFDEALFRLGKTPPLKKDGKKKK